MDKKTLKELESILDKKFDQKLKPINSKLDTLTLDMAEVQSKLEPINSKLDALTLDMIEVQRKTDAIRDIHALVKDTRETVKDHEQRLEILENTV